MPNTLTNEVFNRLGRLGRRLKPAVIVYAPGQSRPKGALRRGRPVLALASGVLAFAAFQAVLSGASFFTLLVADPVYADKERQLRSLEEKAAPGAQRIILLGTSRTSLGFAAGRTQSAANAAGTPAVIFNHGVAGAGPVTQLIHLRRLLAAGHKPDRLIIEVLPPLLSHLPDGPFEARLLQGEFLTRAEIEGLGRYGFPVKRLRRQWRRAAALPAYVHRFKLLGRLDQEALPWKLRFNAGRPPDPNGWNPSMLSEVSDELRARATAWAVAEYEETLKYDLTTGPAVEALRDLLSLCREERIPTTLILFPEGTTFRSLYPPDSDAKVSRLLAELSAEYGFPLVDARHWMTDDQFFDSHHLLPRGAIAFTDRLTAEVILPLLCDPGWRKGQ